MIYLDYSATTKADYRVLNYFNLACDKYFANANSPYKIGRNSRSEIRKANRMILSLLHLDNFEVIYTSCATEANNLAIKGVVQALKGAKKRIVTSVFEHSSVIAPINVLQKQGYTVNIVRHDKGGQVDLQHLKELMGPDVVLVSIASVNSEIGIRQPIDKIAAIAHESGAYFHCDVTQSIGKEFLNFEAIDLMTLSAHKFFGLKGIGALIKRQNVALAPQLHGGSSTTIYRAGTPNTPLILSLKKALGLAYKNYERKYAKVQSLNHYLRELLNTIPNVIINSPENGLPHILNFSLVGHLSQKIVETLSKQEIYVSNHSACGSSNDKSAAVLALSDSEERALSSIRVSISHLTNKREINGLVTAIEKASHKS